MAGLDDVDKSKALNEIKAFNLMNEGLLSLDAYKRTYDKSQLSEARTAFDKALNTLEENQPLYSRANYFLGIAKYLSEPKETLDVAHFKPRTDKNGSDWSAYDAEAHYNTGAAYYAHGQYDKSAEHFEKARDGKKASREVHLLAGAGIALSLARQLQKLPEPEEVRKKVYHLYREVKREIRFNSLRRLVGARHVERALSDKAHALIIQAREEVSKFSPPRSQTPPVEKPAEPDNLAGAT